MYATTVNYRETDYNMRLVMPGRDDVLRMLELKRESWGTTHHVTIRTTEAQVAWWNQASQSRDDYYFAVYHNDVPVGLYTCTGIDWINRTCEQSHHVYKDRRGKGYSYPVMAAGLRFVFDVLNMRRVDAEVLQNNPASMKTALALGFVKEGVRREAVIKSGEPIDSDVIGLLREEFKG